MFVFNVAVTNVVNCASGGYGSATLNVWRQLYGTMHRRSEFPLTLGRDFSGDIVDMGCGVDQSMYRIGDAVSRGCILIVIIIIKQENNEWHIIKN